MRADAAAHHVHALERTSTFGHGNEVTEQRYFVVEIRPLTQRDVECVQWSFIVVGQLFLVAVVADAMYCVRAGATDVDVSGHYVADAHGDDLTVVYQREHGADSVRLSSDEGLRAIERIDGEVDLSEALERAGGTEPIFLTDDSESREVARNGPHVDLLRSDVGGCDHVIQLTAVPTLRHRGKGVPRRANDLDRRVDHGDHVPAGIVMVEARLRRRRGSSGRRLSLRPHGAHGSGSALAARLRLDQLQFVHAIRGDGVVVLHVVGGVVAASYGLQHLAGDAGSPGAQVPLLHDQVQAVVNVERVAGCHAGVAFEKFHLLVAFPRFTGSGIRTRIDKSTTKQGKCLGFMKNNNALTR